MAGAPTVLIAGASGVFGRRLARELLVATGATLVLAGRRIGPLEEAARELDPARCLPLALDLRDPGALEAAARGTFAVACTAGPSQDLDPALPDAAIRAGAHWLDIADSTGWVQAILRNRTLSGRAAAVGLVVAPGLSTLPCLAMVLARALREESPHARTARALLFIGNRNRKGVASVATGLLSAAGAPVRVETPVGHRPAWRFGSPLPAILREELGLEAEFRVAFELPAGFRLARASRPLGRLFGSEGLPRLFALLSRPIAGLGSDEGRISVEVEDASGVRAAASFTGRGQRMPVLPLAVVLAGLLSGEIRERGVLRCWNGFSPGEWTRRLRDRGLERGGIP
ncbi:MAG: hypothetical protein L0216_10375 [Planctomycetales bacterium]|nr:hypothetical protein [Planctomycetales bacterium]